VHFLGPQKQVTPLFALADSVIIPSLYDPFANVTVEALAMGLYVVSSAFNGGKEVLTCQSGTVIEDLMNSQSFASALKRALKHKKTALSSKAIRDSISHLDFSSQLEHFVSAILEDL
jgi:UDP-glucose:(heptosyl)LPS alpha-1,3-glucosyltransferase